VRKLIYSFSVSLDGYIADADGNLDWGAPDEELHRVHNELTRELDVVLLGRGLYETMLFWETAEEKHPDLPEVQVEFARIWREKERLVFSRTLEGVEGDARLTTEDPADVVARLKAEPGNDISVGGAGLASSLIEHDLVDEYRLFVNSVIVGGGTPFFPAHAPQLDLRLVETRRFERAGILVTGTEVSSPVVYLRYERQRAHR